jgi:photosystem II PsbX protein
VTIAPQTEVVHRYSSDKINQNQLVVTEGFEFMTPSLANFLYSLLAGALIIVLPATVALIFISQKDKIKRNI